MKTIENLVKTANDLIAAPSCCAELKEAAQNWINAIGTANEKASAKHLIDELSVDVMTVDAVIAFMTSEAGIAHLGAELAGNIAKHAQEIKAAGAVYCDCPACTAGLEILNNKDVIL